MGQCGSLCDLLSQDQVSALVLPPSPQLAVLQDIAATVAGPRHGGEDSQENS